MTAAYQMAIKRLAALALAKMQAKREALSFLRQAPTEKRDTLAEVQR